MTVFELLGQEAMIDWSSRPAKRRIGLFTTAAKAEAEIENIKKIQNWRMDWDQFHIVEVEVK